MKMSSHTSGSVLTLMLSVMPLAAQRLGDAEVLVVANRKEGGRLEVGLSLAGEQADREITGTGLLGSLRLRVRRGGRSKVSGTLRGTILATYYILFVTLRYAFDWKGND